MNADELCRRLEHDVAPLEENLRLVSWDAECTGRPEAFEQVKDRQTALMNRLAYRDDYRLVEQALESSEPGTDLHRQLVRWRLKMAPRQISAQLIERLAREETELVQQYNGFRASIKGQPVGDNQIDSILRESRSSSQVEEAWRASKKIGDSQEEGGRRVVDRLLDLVRLRNDSAREIGYDNGYVASLELSELELDALFDTLGALDRATRPIFTQWKQGLDDRLAERFGIASSELRPWHYGDRFFQSPPAVDEPTDLDAIYRDKDIVDLTARSFDAMGFDIRSIVARSDLFPGDPAKSRKSQHAFCTSIDPPRDVRVLCNIVPGARWMSVNLHEFGHAVYGASLDETLPFILRDDAHLLANEAIALLMERQMIDEDWLTRMVGLDQQTAAKIAADGRRQLAVKHLVFTRWVLVMCHFERALYENPDRPDLNRLWWDVVEEYQQVRRPEPDREAPDWASKIHFVGYPAYYQNYLLGEVFGTQLEQAVVANCGRMFLEPASGEFLRTRMFREGARYHWRELLERITGESFRIEPFLNVIEGALG